MAQGEKLHPLQQKFLEMAALQCGICTSGMLVASDGAAAEESASRARKRSASGSPAISAGAPVTTRSSARFWRPPPTCGRTSAMNIVTNNKWIGQRTIRPDGADKVTGRAAFAADTTMPGMIWGKVLRSPHPHARIKSIDTSKAEALPGVKAVVTARDIVDFPIDKSVMLGIQDMRWMCRNVMAREKALFPGHPVAAVAATSEAIAAQGLRADRGRLRSAAVGDRDRRRAQAGRADPARLHTSSRASRPTSPASSRSRRATSRKGFARGRDRHRAQLHHPPGASGLYRAARLPDQRRAPTTRPRSGARARASSWCAP